MLSVLGAAVVSRVTAAQYAESEAAVRHTLAVRAAISDTLSLLKDAETGQRGYLLTGDPAFLEPHASAEHGLAAQLERLRVLTREDPEQAKSFDEVERLADDKLDLVGETIEMHRSGRAEAAVAIVRGGAGKRLMDALRAEAERMLKREAVRLAERERDAERGQRRTRFGWSAALFVALAVALGGFFSSRRAAADALRARQRLIESERAFRNLADNAGDLVRILEADLRPCYVSPSSVALLGYAPDEMLAMPGASLLHPDDRARGESLVARVRATGEASEPFEHRLICQNGEYRWFETRIQPALDESGNGRVHLSSRDITARKEAEDALRKQTARLESILTSMGDGVLVLDSERRVLVVNPAAKEHVRHDQGEIISGAKWAEEYSAFLSDRETPFPLQDGPLTRALHGESVDNVEMVLQDRAGRQRVYSITARPLEDEGVRVGAVGVYHDITEQRRAERELLESERRWRALSEASFEGVAIQKNGVLVETNEVFARSLGRTTDELRGSDGFLVFAPEDRPHVRTQSQQFGTVYEARMLHADGSTFPVEIRGRAAMFNGEKVRVAVVRDITEKKQREAELKEQAEQLRTLSLRDELSGLYNRRGFLELARQQLRHIARGQRGGCLFYADLNGMKGINDNLGHDMGDRALVATAKLLTAVFRDSDIVARLGGDEFAALASDCDEAGLAALKQRLKAAVDDFNTHTSEPFRLSISVGGALFDPLLPATLEALMEQADAKMYEEKKARSTLRIESSPASGEPSQTLPSLRTGAA